MGKRMDFPDPKTKTDTDSCLGSSWRLARENRSPELRAVQQIGIMGLSGRNFICCSYVQPQITSKIWFTALSLMTHRIIIFGRELGVKGRKRRRNWRIEETKRNLLNQKVRFDLEWKNSRPGGRPRLKRETLVDIYSIRHYWNLDPMFCSASVGDWIAMFDWCGCSDMYDDITRSARYLRNFLTCTGWRHTF